MSAIVIIGAGECGARAAFELRNGGFEGTITLYGEEAIAPYERPPLSKAALENAAQHKSFADDTRYVELGIELKTGCKVSGVDAFAKTVHINDGSTQAYNKLLFATGARPRLWPGITKPSDRVLSLRTSQDASALRGYLGAGRKLIVIGGGFIGLEVAATAIKAGTQVTLIEAQSRILGRGVPEEIANVVAARHIAEGVDLRTGVGIASIEENASSVTVELQNGDVIEADAVLVGIGAEPNTEIASSAGLAIDNGIAVNEWLETSSADIWAAGDCCSFPLAMQVERRVRLESWRNAQDQAALVAKSMLGHGTPYQAVPWFWSDQYDLSLQVAGMADASCHTIVRPLENAGMLVFSLNEQGLLKQIAGISVGNGIARDIKIGEMLIAKGKVLNAQALTDPSVKLKTMLS